MPHILCYILIATIESHFVSWISKLSIHLPISVLFEISKKSNNYYHMLTYKLNDPSTTSTKSYWSVLKTLYKREKIPLIALILIINNLISNFKEKENHFNAFFPSQCTPISNDIVCYPLQQLLLVILVYYLFNLKIIFLK